LHEAEIAFHLAFSHERKNGTAAVIFFKRNKRGLEEALLKLLQIFGFGFLHEQGMLFQFFYRKFF